MRTLPTMSGLLPAFNLGDAAKAFYLLLDGKEVHFEDLDDLIHLSWRRWESFLSAIIME